jgi:Cof subfamily protein (haloacid dehalogenase superfamily)
MHCEMASPDPSSNAFPYRLAACDLDGTLLGPHKEISPANVAAVRRLQNAGARFVIASGRRHQNSVRFYRQLGLSGLMISCSGALAQDPQTGETLREVLIPAPLAAELVARGEAAGWMVIYYHRDGLYVNRRDHWTELYESRVNERAASYLGGLDALRGEAALKIVWYGDPDQLQARRAEIEADYRGQLMVLSTDPENLEFLAPAANKAEAVAAVANYYGVSQSATLAFGDGENDAPMLRWVACGVAVDRGDATAKAAARFVGPPGSPEESFARAVEEVFVDAGASTD